MVKGLKGSAFYPLGAQIANTAQVHGIAWCAQYYAKRGVPIAQFLILARGAGVI